MHPRERTVAPPLRPRRGTGKVRRARYVIAIDGQKAFLRRTLVVHHNNPSGEAVYTTKPTRPSRAPRKIRELYGAVLLGLLDLT